MRHKDKRHMLEIEVDGCTQIPKETMVYPRCGGIEAPFTRDQVVEVTNVFGVDVTPIFQPWI